MIKDKERYDAWEKYKNKVKENDTTSAFDFAWEESKKVHTKKTAKEIINLAFACDDTKGVIQDVFKLVGWIKQTYLGAKPLKTSQEYIEEMALEAYNKARPYMDAVRKQTIDECIAIIKRRGRSTNYNVKAKRFEHAYDDILKEIEELKNKEDE